MKEQTKYNLFWSVFIFVGFVATLLFAVAIFKGGVL